MLGFSKAENRTNGSKEAAMRSSNASRNAGLKLWGRGRGRGRGRGKPFPTGFREDYYTPKPPQPKGWWDYTKKAPLGLH